MNKLFLIIMLGIFSNSLYAYIGPGAGISAIGSALAFIVIVLLLIVGVLWYPLKKMFGKKQAADTQAQSKDSDQSQGL